MTGTPPADYIDGYCERLAPGLLGEPLNAVTNFAFILMALWLWRQAVRNGRGADPLLRILVLLLVATGVGSLIFHTWANRLGAVLDTVALTACLLAAFLFSARRWLGWPWWKAMLWPLGMIGAALVLGAVIPVGGAPYLGPFVTGLAMAAVLNHRGHWAARHILAATVVFVPSFTFRTLDPLLCDVWPYGTHFLWHICNAFVLGFAIMPFTRREATEWHGPA